MAGRSDSKQWALDPNSSSPAQFCQSIPVKQKKQTDGNVDYNPKNVTLMPELKIDWQFPLILHPYLFDLNVKLHTQCFIARLQFDAFLRIELWRFTDPPIPRGKVLSQLVESREPFLCRINQLESSLLHHMITTTVTELLGWRPQKLVSNCSEQLLHGDIFIDISEIFYGRLDRCCCFADDFSLCEMSVE